MVPPDSDSGPPAQPAASQPSPDCALAERWILAFLAGTQARAENRALRAHLAGCPRCDELYRREAVLLAKLGRGSRRRAGRKRPIAKRPDPKVLLAEISQHEEGPALPGPPEDPRPHPRVERRGASESPTGSASRSSGGQAAGAKPRAKPRAKSDKRPDWIQLRLILLPAFAIFLMLQQAGLWERVQGFELAVLAGRVELGPSALGSAALGPEHEPCALEPGALCATDQSGRALVRRGSTRLFLDGDTELVLESESERRVRIGIGSLVAHGPCTIVTLDGIVEVSEGAVVKISARKHTTEVEALAGQVAMENAAERREVSPGESFAFAR